ncbi:MAG: peptidoglycan DD-metalloendopeptidase family protein [Candidatus Poseidoniaceae archaeon]
MWGSPDLAGSGENNFHPIVHLPEEYWVLNLQKPQTQWNQHYEFTIGRYDEDRKGMYTQALFGGERTIHVGLDIGGPAQTSIYAFEDGIIHSFTDNDVDGSYGPTIITQHELLIEGEEQTIWVLHGHLSRESLHDLVVGNRIKKGDQIGTMGDEHENGGWPPHVHIQLSLIEPEVPDLEGVVAPEQREDALKRYPDPRNILGRLY